MPTEINTVRTYMNYPASVDPARILSMADLELSVALASTLVTFDSARQVTSALAEKWEIIPPRTIQFKLRKNLVWSDGKPITSEQFKLSLERAKRDYASDLKSLFESIESISAPDANTLQIKTTTEVGKSGILLKLTEPMYALIALKDGKPNLSKTSGPFYIHKQTKEELTLKANSHWYSYTPKMPMLVEIRPVDKKVDLVEHFPTDEWVNLVSATSLMEESTAIRLEQAGFTRWQRSLDKVFSFYPSKKFLKANGAKKIQALSRKIDAVNMMKGLSGFSPAEQFFPRGYELWSPEKPVVSSTSVVLPGEKLHLIIPASAYSSILKENLSKAIVRATNSEPQIEIIELNSLNTRMKAGNFDILATGIAVADPNFEGAMSFFIERDPPFIQSGDAPFDFSPQLRLARGLSTSAERAKRMKEITIKAQESGYVLPLFHFSSLAIAKSGIDLSEIPNTDETVLFSKLRMK